MYNSANFAGPSKGTLHTQLVIMLKHWVFFFLLKMNTTLFQILQIIQLKVISYLDTDQLPFLEKGEGAGWIFLQIILKLQNNCNYAWIWAGVVAFLVDRRFDLYIKVHIFVVWHFASYKFWNVFDDKRKGNIMLFSIMELFTKAWTNHYFTFKGKEGLGFSSGPDCFPFAGFFLHCKYILFVNLQIFFY